MVFSTMFFMGGTALAQTGYPPGTTIPPGCTSGAVNAGAVTVGQTITFTLCGPFAPGAMVTLTLDGQAVGSKQAAANGTVVMVVTITKQNEASINDPVLAAIVCGTNTATATGTNAAGATVTASGTFNLNCTAAPTTTTTNGGLALTGANILKALLVAVALIGLGVLLVTAQRRRRRTA